MSKAPLSLEEGRRRIAHLIIDRYPDRYHPGAERLLAGNPLRRPLSAEIQRDLGRSIRRVLDRLPSRLSQTESRSIFGPRRDDPFYSQTSH